MSAPRSNPALTRARIVEAAVVIADEQGLDGLSMRRLGQSVGVEAMSLYNRVAGKDDLLDGMVDRIFETIDAVSVDESSGWRDAVRQRALAAAAVLTQHRWAVSLLDSRISPGPATMRHFDEVLGTLCRGGFSIQMAARAYSLVYFYVYGSVIAFDPERHASQPEGVAHEAAAGDYPYATAVVRDHLMAPGYGASREFERGLDAILDAVSRLAEA